MKTRDEVREKSKADEERALAVIDATPSDSPCRFGDIVTKLGYTSEDVALRRTNVVDRAIQRLRKRGVIANVGGHWRRVS